MEKTGSTAPQKSVPPPQPSKIKDLDRFEEFVELNADKTQKELAQLWGGVSHHTISRALKKLGYTRKSGVTPVRLPHLGKAHQEKNGFVIKKEVKKPDVNSNEN